LRALLAPARRVLTGREALALAVLEVRRVRAAQRPRRRRDDVAVPVRTELRYPAGREDREVRGPPVRLRARAREEEEPAGVARRVVVHVAVGVGVRDEPARPAAPAGYQVAHVGD